MDQYFYSKLLTLCFLQETENNILCIPPTDNGTEKVVAEAVFRALSDWSVKDNVVAMGFDTTSSNIGIHRKGCTILQQLLSRQLLWLACRHHIPETILAAAAFTTLFGKTTGPYVASTSFPISPTTQSRSSTRCPSSLFLYT